MNLKFRILFTLMLLDVQYEHELQVVYVGFLFWDDDL